MDKSAQDLHANLGSDDEPSSPALGGQNQLPTVKGLLAHIENTFIHSTNICVEL